MQRPELLIVNLHISKQADRRDARHCAGEKLTVVVNTFKRLDLLKNSVQHYSTCPFVSRIHVNWAESTTPPDVEKCQCCQTEVTFALPLLTHNDSSLNTRFHPIPGVLHRLVQVGSPSSVGLVLWCILKSRPKCNTVYRGVSRQLCMSCEALQCTRVHALQMQLLYTS